MVGWMDCRGTSRGWRIFAGVDEDGLSYMQEQIWIQIVGFSPKLFLLHFYLHTLG